MTDITPRDHLMVQTSSNAKDVLDTRGETEEQAMSRLVEDHAVRAIERHLAAAADDTELHDAELSQLIAGLTQPAGTTFPA